MSLKQQNNSPKEIRLINNKLKIMQDKNSDDSTIIIDNDIIAMPSQLILKSDKKIIQIPSCKNARFHNQF